MCGRAQTAERGIRMNRQKSAFGICYWFYTVAAFLLAVLGQTLLCGVLLCFVIATEKNEWLNRQCIQAFLLALVGQVIHVVSGVVTSAVSGVSGFDYLGLFFGGLSAVLGMIFGAVSIVILVFGIIAMVNTAKGKDAGIPGLKQIAALAVGHFPQQDGQNPPQQ